MIFMHIHKGALSSMNNTNEVLY